MTPPKTPRIMADCRRHGRTLHAVYEDCDTGRAIKRCLVCKAARRRAWRARARKARAS